VGGGCAYGTDMSDADFIDQLLAKDYDTRFLSVNRQHLADSHAA